MFVFAVGGGTNPMPMALSIAVAASACWRLQGAPLEHLVPWTVQVPALGSPHEAAGTGRTESDKIGAIGTTRTGPTVPPLPEAPARSPPYSSRPAKYAPLTNCCSSP